jgi:hypothetical protein
MRFSASITLRTELGGRFPTARTKRMNVRAGPGSIPRTTLGLCEWNLDPSIGRSRYPGSLHRRSCNGRLWVLERRTARGRLDRPGC